MRLDVTEPRALRGGDPSQRADLIRDQVFDLGGGELELATAKAREIGEAGMCADRDAMRAALRGTPLKTLPTSP